MSLSGSTGLIRIPTAEVTAYGHYTMGLNSIAHDYRPYPNHNGNTVAHFITVGIVPHLELTGSFINHDGNLGAQFQKDLGTGFGGWNFDRTFNIQAQLLPQSSRCPVSLGAGWQDVVGTGVFRTHYLVLSHREPGFGVHLGYGDGVLNGLFAGVDYLATPNIRLMLDHDGNHPNVGATFQWRHFSFTPVFTGIEAFGGGITYNQHL